MPTPPTQNGSVFTIIESFASGDRAAILFTASECAWLHVITLLTLVILVIRFLFFGRAYRTTTMSAQVLHLPQAPFTTVQLVFPPQVDVALEANARYAQFCNREVGYLW
jgi:hypothetical protein